MCMINHPLNINIFDTNNEPFSTFIYYVTLWRHFPMSISFWSHNFFLRQHFFCFFLFLICLTNWWITIHRNKCTQRNWILLPALKLRIGTRKKYVGIMSKWLWTKDRSIDDWRHNRTNKSSNRQIMTLVKHIPNRNCVQNYWQ